MTRTPTRKASLRPTMSLLRARMDAGGDGVTAIEYALVACGICTAVAATVWALGTNTNGFYASLAAMMQ